MERNDPTSPPDLQAILATLSQYARPDTSLQSGQTNTESCPTSLLSGNDLAAAISKATAGNAADGQEAVPNQPLRPQSRSAQAPPKPMIDPAQITVWPEALRCVTKIASQNAQFAVSIKRMMQDQRAHEMRWYTERQNLKQTQATRSASASKAQAILKSLNTSLHGARPPVDSTEVDQKSELAQFDEKIYNAQQAMEAAMIAELKGLGVPFFGTNPSLVVPDGYDLSNKPLPQSHPKWSVVVTENQLLALRRKMVIHLEDLYRD